MKSKSSIKLETPTRAYALLLHSLCIDLSIPSDLMNRVCGLARARQYGRLVALAGELSSQLYESAEEHFRFNQLALFISKVPFIDAALKPRDVALAKFYASEHRMRRMNAKFRILRSALAGRRPLKDRHQYLFLDRARRFIAKCLGPLELSEVFGEVYIGDGSAVGCRGDLTHVIEKLRKPTVTAGAIPYVLAAFKQNSSLSRLALQGEFSPFVMKQTSRYSFWLDEQATVVDHNLVDFVPKNAKTHRTIALEPSLNGMLQLGIGKVIAKRLARYGCDITDQTKNQRYAEFGSKFHDEAFSVATIDLSSASDSISSELVRTLLPADWWAALNAFRSPCYRIDDGPVMRYEKFATMGNGFCFPLQSLIYLSIVRTVLEETGDTLHAVYGDDIIVPKGAALLVIERLRYCGFRTNVDKTFVHGPFRESCGADFFGGTDVRPFVLDFLPERIPDYVKIANGVSAKLGLHTLTGDVCLYTLTPAHRRYVKPHQTGAVDDAILVDLDEFMMSEFARWDRRRQTWNFKVHRSESAHDEQLLTEYEQLLALNHGSTPGKGRVAAKLGVLGHPALPRRFTARYTGSWYLPDLENLDAAALRNAKLWREDVPGAPAC